MYTAEWSKLCSVDWRFISSVYLTKKSREQSLLPSNTQTLLKWCKTFVEGFYQGGRRDLPRKLRQRAMMLL
jgi:hypothetical protein